MSNRIDVPELIGRWPSLSAFAADAGVTYGAAKQMKNRKSVLPAYWRRAVENGQRRGVAITIEDFVDAHSEERAARFSKQQEHAA